MKNMLEVKSARKSYLINNAPMQIIKGINMHIREGEFVALMGPSGSGKTTLLNIAAGIDHADSGIIKIQDMDIANMDRNARAAFRKEKIGIVFQDFNLIDSLNVKENIILPMELSMYEMSEIDDLVQSNAEILKIEHLLNRDIYELSGGEQQRVAICRAIINNPKIIFADEPTGNLDTKSTRAVMNCFTSINRLTHCAIMMVTHDALSASYCDRVLFMKDGSIIEEIENDMGQEDFFRKLIDYSKIFGETNE